MNYKKISSKYPLRKITQELLYNFDEQLASQLAERLEDDDYTTPFESLDATFFDLSIIFTKSIL